MPRQAQRSDFYEPRRSEKHFLAISTRIVRPLKSAVEFALANWYGLNRESSKIENLPHEEWRDVVDYEGLYQVSNYGRMKSLVWNGGRLINPCLHTGGYMLVGLYKNGKRKNHFVHVLVAKAFVPNPFSKPQVNHIDGDKTNNRVENLEWVTREENINHAFKLGLSITPDQVREIRRIYIKSNRAFGVVALARKFNVSQETIRDIVKRRSYLDVD